MEVQGGCGVESRDCCLRAVRGTLQSRCKGCLPQHLVTVSTELASDNGAMCKGDPDQNLCLCVKILQRLGRDSDRSPMNLAGPAGPGEQGNQGYRAAAGAGPPTKFCPGAQELARRRSQVEHQRAPANPWKSGSHCEWAAYLLVMLTHC